MGLTSGVPITWALNRIEDKLGNAIDFSYGFDGALGEYWLHEVRWSNRNGVLLGRVELNYSLNRSDKTHGHGYGRTRQSLTRRLESIATFEGAGTPVRRYQLGYLQDTGGAGLAGSPSSYLYTVQECAGTGAECLAPTHLQRDVAWRGVKSLS